MKHKITNALLSLLLLAGFFGLQAVAESDLSFGATIGLIIGLLLFLLAVAHVANTKLQTR